MKDFGAQQFRGNPAKEFKEIRKKEGGKVITKTNLSEAKQTEEHLRTKELHGNEGASSEKDENLLLLRDLDHPQLERVNDEMKLREELIKNLMQETGSNPDLCFEKIFGKSSTSIQMEVRPYGIYFFGGDDTAFRRILPSFTSLLHGGATVNKDKYLQEKKFLNIVGFGSRDSMEHEFVHMFNSMLPLHDVAVQYEKIQEDTSLPQDSEGIRRIKSEQYELWVNSILKDEILARINDGQILSAEEQSFDDSYSGEGKIFTSYEPDRLYGHVSPYKSDVERFGTEPVDRATSDEFWKLYHVVVDPMRKYWLDACNQNIRAIKDALQLGIPKSKIKSIIIQERFQDISNKINNLMEGKRKEK